MNATTTTFRDIRNAAQRAARANQHFADTLTKYLDTGELDQLLSVQAESQATAGGLPQPSPPPKEEDTPARAKPAMNTASEHFIKQPVQPLNQAAQRPDQPPRPAAPGAATAQPSENQYGLPHHSNRSNIQPEPSLFERMIASSSMKDNKLVAWWQREETVTKILAVLGGIITIIGLVFLAMLAYATGILGPRSSVILAAVACVVVFASAFQARKNNPDGVLGPALIVVATLGALADIWVAVFKLEWYSPVLGSVITTLLVLIGLLVAYTWNHEKLGVIITIFAPAFILPVAINVLNDSFYSPAFTGCILATALAAFAVRWGNQWPSLHMIASIVFIIGVALTYDNPLLTLLAGSVGVGLLVIFSYEQPIVSRELEVLSWMAFLFIPTFMCINQGAFHYIFSGLVFVAMLAWTAANGGNARFEDHRRGAKDNATIGFYVASLAVSTSLLWEYAEHGHAIFGMIFMLIAIGMVYLLPRTEPMAAMLAIVVGLLVPLSDTVVAWAGSGKGEHGAMTVESVIMILLASILAAGMVLKRKELSEPASDADGVATGMDDKAQMVLFLIALFQISAVVPAVALLINDSELSYMVAQLIISVTWMFLGIKLINHENDTFRKAGLALTLLATAKLILFDLSVLGGLVQVIAFIVSGVILLVAAFNREKILKQPEQQPQPQGANPYGNRQR